MSRTLRSIALAALALLAVSAIAACSDNNGDNNDGTSTADASMTATSGADSEHPTVNASVSEWKVEPDKDSVSAGTVTFNVTNKGTTEHEFVVVKSDKDPGDLPKNAEGVVDEEAVDIIGEVEALQPDAEGNVSLNLEPGSYVLMCNLPAHYDQGMYTSFTVE